MTYLKNIFPALILLFSAQFAVGQITISGTVKEKKGTPVPFANVYLKETSYGNTTDSLGNFTFTTTEKGNKILAVSSVGYKNYEQPILLADADLTLEIILEVNTTTLGDVVISAGSFEASDKAKGASLTPIDAVTVAGNGGDVAMALRALPGAQQMGEREGLFVRGGTGEETKQFIDGLLIKNPNYSSVPGMPQPARVNPFLFKGILFSTGGYSALYGQALSSALILESVDLPEQSSASLHLFPTSTGAGFQQLAHNKKSSYGINVSYGNYALNNSIIPQKPDFFHGPEYISSNANVRVKTSKTGILKLYTNYGYSNVGMRNPDVDSANLKSSFHLKSKNLYVNLSYQEFLNENWEINAGTAYNYNQDHISNQLLDANNRQVFIDEPVFADKNNIIRTHTDFAQGRVVFNRFFSNHQTLRFGSEYFYTKDQYQYNDNTIPLQDHLSAAFAEGDIYLSPNMAGKVGVRFEHSSLLQQATVAPRASMAYRFNRSGQINLAYGIFYQKPENQFLVENKGLDFSRATHYVINYQRKADNRFLRVETYYKQYDQLVTTEPTVANHGNGYARGIELFWRDKKTFKDLDYWITYTYLDTERKFLNYPAALQPNFATPHTATIAIKKFFQAINLNANLAYTFTTGRPYYFISPDVTAEQKILDEGTTSVYSGLNMSFAYLTTFFKKWKDFSGIGFGVNNILGSKQIFGYNYSHDGSHKAVITLPSTSSFYIGVFMSFGTDRTEDFINDNL